MKSSLSRIGLLMIFAMSSVFTNAQEIVLPKPERGGGMPLMEALAQRQTYRDFIQEDLPDEILSTLLWSAYGFNREKEQKRTAPSARNAQEMDLYVFRKDGVYQYDAHNNLLKLVDKRDCRKEISQQEHFAVAPIAIVIVANYDRMKNFDTEGRTFYSDVDCGYVSQNIYLACASLEMGTVACGAIDRTALAKILHIKNGKALLAHPVGMVKK